MIDAWKSIAERHEDLKGKEELVGIHARQVTLAFNEGLTELSHLQLATACLAFLNREKEPRQIWVVPAG